MVEVSGTVPAETPVAAAGLARDTLAGAAAVRIGELHRRTGVSQRSLRYYEEQDLLRPARRPSGYRDYSQSDVETVLHSRNLLAAGLSTITIADLLPCMGTDGERLVVDCFEVLVDLHRERDRISTSIRELEFARSTLDAVISTAPPETRRAAAGAGLDASA